MMRPDPADPPAFELPAACSPNGYGDTVVVTFISLEGVSVILDFPRRTTLKAMQKQLCSAFGKNYPYTAAYLSIGTKGYSDFDATPLLEAVNGDTANITFVRQIADPSGYVEVARKHANKITLQQECAWEDLVAKGETNLSLEEWIFSARRNGK